MAQEEKASGAITRRRLLWAGGATTLALAGAWPLSQVLSEDPRSEWRRGAYGPMRRDPRGVLDLPEGFSYRVLDRAGQRMDDGLFVPQRPDGMACFDDPVAGLVLMRNHENPARAARMGPWGSSAPAREAFDPLAMGGVTRIVLDPTTFERRASNLVLGGTLLNCAGGPSPWGWLSCEETVEPGHGFVFACDPRADRVTAPEPIRSYGRFRHEAAAVDPATNECFLTEDRDDGCLYRFAPSDPDRPFEGELRAMRVRGRPNFATATQLAPGERLEIEWVPVGDPTPDDDVLRYTAAREGAATVKRGEGIAFDPGGSRPGLVFCASTGGPREAGQIFRLEPDGDGGELVVLAQSTGRSDFDMPDNVTVSPSGTVFFCEDGLGGNYLRGIDPSTGRIFDFAHNALSRSELAGVCFSPDGRAMFVALQTDGLTLCVTGPFA